MSGVTGYTCSIRKVMLKHAQEMTFDLVWCLRNHIRKRADVLGLLGLERLARCLRLLGGGVAT